LGEQQQLSQALKNPDSLFAVALVLLGIFSVDRASVDLSTAPFLLLIFLWLLNEMLIKGVDGRVGIFVMDFCWALWSSAMFLFVFSVLHNFLHAFTSYLQLGGSVVFFTVIALGYYTSTWSKDGKYFRNSRRLWISEKIIVFCLSYALFWLILLFVSAVTGTSIFNLPYLTLVARSLASFL
jgi:hypothetical protein